MPLTYKDLIDTVIQREMGILGKSRMQGILDEVGYSVDAVGKLQGEQFSISHLEDLMRVLSERYGAVAVMGCKIAVGRLARENKLELPAILR